MNNSGSMDLMSKVESFQLPVNGFENDDLEQDLIEFKRKFEKKKKASRKKARMLVQSCAKLFLDADMLTKDEYAKYKVEVDSYSLANTLFQLHTSHKAIESLSEKIHMSASNSRHYEVLASLQRIVLDINKFLMEHLTAMEESYRDLRDKIIDMKIEKAEDTELVASSDTRIAFTTRDAFELMEQLQQLSAATAGLEKIPSNNEKLVLDGDDRELAINIEKEADNHSTEGDIASFDGYEY